MLNFVDQRQAPTNEEMEERPARCSYPNLRHIRLLDSAAACGSLSRAANEIHISQPAATQAITRLEEQFGVQLLLRGSNGISLTERGALVVARFRRALQCLRKAGQDIQRQSRVDGGASDILETHSTIAHLRAIAAFADTGSFAAAGKFLDQAESSVHRAARQLERIAGVPLFEERSRHLRLTSVGRLLAVQANLFLAEIVSAHEELLEYEGSFSGRVRIGTLPLVRNSIVPQLVARVSRQHPQAVFEISDGDYDSQIAALVAGRIDMLVGALRSTQDVGLIQQELFCDALSVIARRKHPLLMREMVTRQDLANYPWVVSRQGTPTRAIFDRLALGAHGISNTVSPPIIAGSSDIVRGILLETDRLTILSPRQIAHEIDSGLLGVVAYDLENTERRIGMTFRMGWQPTALQRIVVETLQEIARG
ncbi:LysR family transcriptional regulator [Rhizobium sp. RU36D]|uniref:LysR family transcriptional regulator n=1 Tax=Rhizobium sp. RU36D TaxID=1907415 RepID=UPI0009D7E436|nr:LysR family transcriptional regulator [Rhizobium sp. RU36D]SMD01468.1 DNA-binding transcriptional regulator, LysR family [Rhizobium sp. RU36D]